MARRNQENKIRNPSSNWRDTIDGWVKDPKIRRHLLIALCMVLTAAVITVAIVANVLSTILVGGTLAAAGGGWLHHRQRNRVPTTTCGAPSPGLAEDHRPATHPSTTSSRDPEAN
jgi:hypothetical protein